MQLFVLFKQQLLSFYLSCHTSGMRSTASTHHPLTTNTWGVCCIHLKIRSKHWDKENMKALPTCDLSHKILWKLFNVLEVCFFFFFFFGLCMQNREGVFREKASRAGIGKKAVGNSFLVKEQYWKRCFFSTLVGYPLQVKVIQHAQADHPLSLAQLLLGWGFYTFCEFFTCLKNGKLVYKAKVLR